MDSGVLIKLYLREPNSDKAIAAIQRFASIPLIPLHEIEIRNTFRTLEGRSVITPAQRAASEHMFDTDIAAARLRRSSPDWYAVCSGAIVLSREHGTTTLARSLDILHVSAALQEGADLFITSDLRQSELAERAQLSTQVIE